MSNRTIGLIGTMVLAIISLIGFLSADENQFMKSAYSIKISIYLASYWIIFVFGRIND
jgi:hypothetical protein